LKRVISKGYKFGFLDVFGGLVMIFLILPIVIIVLFSFNPTSATIFPMTGFTTRWYKEVLKNELFISGIINSIYVALIASSLSVIIGMFTSFALIRYKFKFKEIMSYVVLLPITLPAILLGIALLSFFASLNVSRSLLTVILSHVVFCTPFVVLIMNSRLEELDIAVEEAAKDLGANNIQTFRYIIFPLIRPSLIGTMMITFGLSFDEFLVTFFVIGRKNTLPIVIWGMLRRGVSPSINAIATMILIISMVLIITANRILKLRTLY